MKVSFSFFINRSTFFSFSIFITTERFDDNPFVCLFAFYFYILKYDFEHIFHLICERL